jgi:hypothetical protein
VLPENWPRKFTLVLVYIRGRIQARCKDTIKLIGKNTLSTD